MYIRKCALFVVSILLAATMQAQQLNVGTYNLRFDNPRDSGNLWVNRAPIVAGLIKFHAFDVFGTQEGLLNQLEDIKTALPEYAYYGIGRDDGKNKGEHSAIFYKKAKFTVVKSGDFWLSTTPEQPGPGWDAHINRICSWLLLQDKQSKKQFYFFNVHYDHQGVEARRQSSQLILQKIKAIAGKVPAIFTGDLNGGHQSQWYLALKQSGFLKDTYDQVTPYENNGTFNGFGGTVTTSEVIDHIFITAAFKVQQWGILSDSYRGKYPSDHFPVQALISW